MFTPSVIKSTSATYLRAFIMVVLAAFAFVSLSSGALSASAPRKYAGIVVDAKTGKTLYESAADSARYPASVTKVMTLYVLFQELEAGRLSLSTRMTVSKHAAAAVPTKLGLKAGSTIKVEDAIKALVTLSANDIARVIAEHISGTESKFAVRMTKTARALGMSRTTYKNASGLPDSGQLTTVRDQATLGAAVFQHFPKYYDYFQTRSFKFGKRTYGNHNRLLGSVPGVDGIKTGYINASGYNLLTAARKDGRHIVVVGFGFDSGASRNAKVAALVKKYFPKARSGSYYASAMIPKVGGENRVRVASVPPQPASLPSFRGQGAAQIDTVAPPMPVQVASADIDAPTPQARPVDLLEIPSVQAVNLAANDTRNTPIPLQKPENIIGAWISDTLKLDRKTGRPIPPAAIGQTLDKQALDLMTSGSVSEEPTSNIESWIVQIGAAPSEDGAEKLLAHASERLDDLIDYRKYIERFEKNGQTYYRARFAGFAGRDQAASMCTKIKQENMSCLAVQG